MASKRAGLKRTRCGIALSTRLGAVRRQLGREYLHLAVLSDLLAGQVHDARVGLVRTRCERHRAHSSLAAAAVTQIVRAGDRFCFLR